MDIVTLDFETFFSKDYSLRKKEFNTSSYIRSPQFKAQCVGVKINDGPVRWYRDKDIAAALHSIKWGSSALLCHNTNFDGLILSHHYGIVPARYLDTLSMARALHSNAIGAGLDEVARFYGVGNKLPNVLDKTKGIRDLGDELMTNLGEYCAEDVRLTYEIYQRMVKYFPQNELDLIDITIRMFADPVLCVDLPAVEKELQRELKEQEGIIARSGHSKKSLASADTFAGILRAHGVEPPTKISETTGKLAWAFAKTDVEFQALADHEDEHVRCLHAARLAAKSTINETRAYRFLEAGRDEHKLPVALAYFGAHCVTGNTEVLTQSGWQRIDAWGGGVIAQVHKDSRCIEFLHADKFTGPVINTWVSVSAPNVHANFTMGHTVPSLTARGNAWVDLQGVDLPQRALTVVPTTGTLTAQGGISEDQMRVLVMIQADGSFNVREGRQVTLRLKFKKLRKIERCRKLLDSVGVKYTERFGGTTTFYVAARNIPSWISVDRKIFGPWLLDSSIAARQAFVEELPLWDGSFNSERTKYCTSIKGNAEWAHTLCHLSNQMASMSTSGGMYTVTVKRRNTGRSTIKRKHVSTKHLQETAYCTITETGYWLARHNGHIFITGNTGRWTAGNKMNMQNLPSSRAKCGGALRKAILAPKGYKIVVCDSAQIEARVLAWLAGQTDLVDDFRNKVDVYSKFGTELYQYPVSKATPTERHVSKGAILGLGFGMGAPKMKKTFKGGTPSVDLSEGECRVIVQFYRNKYKHIPKLWRVLDKVLAEMALDKKGSYKCVHWDGKFLILPNGLYLMYPFLRGDFDEYSGKLNNLRYYDMETGMKVRMVGETEALKKKASYIWGGAFTENIVQALARIIVADQMRIIAQRYRVVMMTHDEVVALAPEGEADECLEFMINTMSTPPAWAPDIPLGAEGGYADNYSK